MGSVGSCLVLGTAARVVAESMGTAVVVDLGSASVARTGPFCLD